MSSNPAPAETALASTPVLPEPVLRRGISEPQWRTLCNSLYPGADPQSVLLVWDYCAARNLDPLKKPCHIVPMEVKDARTGNYAWRDVVMPGIYEYRITAHRTGDYLGHPEPVLGPDEECRGVVAPAWCDFTAYRRNRLSGERVSFPVRVFFGEVVATKKDGSANGRWTKAPRQMLTKCAEAAALREAFPEEIGGEPTAEEMDGQHAVIDVTPERARGPQPVKMPQRVESRASSSAPVSPAGGTVPLTEAVSPAPATPPRGRLQIDRVESKLNAATPFWQVFVTDDAKPLITYDESVATLATKAAADKRAVAEIAAHDEHGFRYLDELVLG